MTRRAAAAVLAAALLLYVFLCLGMMRSSACTFDEPIHLPPGWVSWKLGDHRMNPDHPPLVRRLAALPLLAMDVKMDPEDHSWKVSRPWEFGKRFLFRWNDADRLLFWGRLAIVLLVGVPLALAVFLWTRRLFGAAAACFALFFFVLDPDMLAHGAIVANDLGITLFLFLGVIAFVAAQAGVSDVRSWSYLGLNFFGALVLGIVAWHERQYGFLLLEGVWTIVSAWGLVTRARGAPV